MIASAGKAPMGLIRSRMKSVSPILEYRGSAEGPADRGVQRFHAAYGIAMLVAYLTIGYCLSSWPQTSNSLDPHKSELAMTIQVTGGAACAWLVLALRRILLSNPISRSVWTWLLVAANAVVGLAVFPSGYQ